MKHLVQMIIIYINAMIIIIFEKQKLFGSEEIIVITEYVKTKYYFNRKVCSSDNLYQIKLM